MGAQHQNALLINLHQKGIAQFDADSVLAMIAHDYTTPGIDHPCGGVAGNRHLDSYLEYGYVPEEAGAASNTMEYAFDDWCLAEFARSLEEDSLYAHFLERSHNYRHLFDTQTGYLRRRHADGRWVTPFDPLLDGTEGGWNGPGYMEGNAWVYTWYAPHDLPALIDLLGRDTFNHRLEEGFQRGYVDLSNQPNLQAPFLFNYSGQPWQTQRYSRLVADSCFRIDPLTAYVGEEDEGQLSSLYCLLAMGLFQMQAGCGVEPYYDLSSPVFDEVVIHLDPRYYPGGTFTIVAESNGPDRPYIQSATLDEQPLAGPRVPWARIRDGGVLRLRMGAQPNRVLWE